MDRTTLDRIAKICSKNKKYYSAAVDRVRASGFDKAAKKMVKRFQRMDFRDIRIDPPHKAKGNCVVRMKSDAGGVNVFWIEEEQRFQPIAVERPDKP